MNAKERERLEYELYSIKSTIAYMREILDESDLIVLDSFQPIVNRAIDITGEYSFQVNAWFKSYPGPNNTIFVATSEEFVEIYYRGKAIDKVKIQWQYYGGRGGIFEYDDKKYEIIYHVMVEFVRPKSLFSIYLDAICYDGKEIFNGEYIFCKECGLNTLLIIDKNYDTFTINSSGIILHHYSHNKLNEWINSNHGEIHVLSDGKSLFMEFYEKGNTYYQVIQPL